jgi:2-haloacid dehalogenase
MRELPIEPDVRPALLALRDAGIPAAIVTNGDAATTAAMLRRAELTGLFETVVTVDEVGLWKPRAEVYQHVARLLSLEPGDVTLVAAHPWDIHGAREAGLGAAWIRREERIFPSAFTPPDTQADSLVDLVETLLIRSARR